MSLVIRHVSEPFAGRSYTIDADADEVRFGRELIADITFPAELDLVGRDHFRLRREAGAWKFVIAKSHPVFANGRPLLDGEELDEAMEIQLSGPNGPRLKLEPQAGSAGNLPKTRVLSAGQDIGDVATASRRSGRRLAAWLGGVTLAVAGIAAVIFFLRQDVSEVAGRIPTVEQQIAAVEASAAARLDSASILGKVQDSVYLVALKRPTGKVTPMGTASVIRLPNGEKALATNAHITEPVKEYLAHPESGLQVVVIQPRAPDYTQLVVTGAESHPAYVEFGQWQQRMAGLRAESRVDDVKIDPPGYDVGVLYVADPEALAEPLEIATADALAALDSGTPLVMTGYPAQNVSGTDPERPAPTGHVGIVTSMTTFYLFHSAKGDNRLVQHSLPTAGGASGSPMFNAQGKLVAIHNATNPMAGYPTSSMINYGQRADLLLDLLDGSAMQRLGDERRDWAAVEDRLTKQDPAIVITDLVNDFMIELGAQAQEIQRVDLPLDTKTEGGPHAFAAMMVLDLEPGAAYLIVARSADRRPVMLTAYADNQPVAGSVGGWFVTSTRIDNGSGYLRQVLLAIVDQSSLGEKVVTPGSVTLRIWKAASYSH